MSKKNVLLSILLILIVLAVLSMLLERCHQYPGGTIISDKLDGRIPPSDKLDGEPLPHAPEEVPDKSPESPVLVKVPKATVEMPSTQPKKASPPESLEASSTRPIQGESAMTPSSVSLEALPTQSTLAESAMKRSVLKASPVALSPGAAFVGKLCGGEPISQCVDVVFTHCDFALLIIDILAPARTEDCKEAFEILESLQIGPIGGWAKANAQKRMTPRQMEEVRCSISFASEHGLSDAGPSIVTAALNRFCEELKVSIGVVEDSGIAKDRADATTTTTTTAETGHQGEGEGVASSPF